MTDFEEQAYQSDCEEQQLYQPDSSVVRKPSSHTMRKLRYNYGESDIAVSISRPISDDGIPITELDDMISRGMVSKKWIKK